MTRTPPPDPHPASTPLHGTRNARVIGPVVYTTSAGRKKTIPLGPCLLEHDAGRGVDIVWGASGQHSAALPVEDLQSAASSGHIVLLD